MQLTISKRMGLGLLKLKNKKPEIILAGSLLGIVGSFVMVGRESRKLDDILIEAERKMDVIDAEEVDDEKNTEIAIIKKETAIQVVRLYTPSVVTLVISLAGVVYSQKLMSDKVKEIAAAYMAVSESFNQYKKRVVDKYGTDAERAIRYGYEDIDKEKVTVTDENGKKKKEEVTVTQPGKINDEHSKFFDSASCNWRDDPELNMNFLLGVLSAAQRKFEYQGFLFLNDVLDMLDIPKTAAGHIDGWVWKPGEDNKIDFGIFDIKNEATRRFVNGYEAVILLNFNCKSDIVTQIPNWDAWRECGRRS